MSQKRKRSASPPPQPNASSTTDIFTSAPITDRKSTFVGYFSPTLSPRSLQQHSACRSASHKVLAWRKPAAQKTLVPTNGGTTYTTDHDDDGEQHAGKRVAGVLSALNVSGSCVVARWYGGVMLGPVRFAHIEGVAREAVEKYLAFVNGAKERAKREEEVRKRKVLEEEQKERLVGALGERDRSIVVLRGLVAEKEDKVKRALVEGMRELDDEEGAGEVCKEDVPTPSAASPAVVPKVDYASMPLDRLRALDKARDATLAFLLKRIDKAEADLLAIEGPEKVTQNQ